MLSTLPPLQQEPTTWDRKRLKRLRGDLDISQEALAREVGVSRVTLSRIETGVEPDSYQPRSNTQAKLDRFVVKQKQLGRLPPDWE